MAPVLFKKVDFLNYAVDFNKKIGKKPILGKNKTFRGLFFGIILSIITVYLQKLINIPSIVDYNTVNPLVLGFLLGFGALFGDLVKSFFKRQLNIQPGKPFIPFDQIDWILGAMVFALFYVKITFLQAASAVIIFGILHPFINILGFWLKLKKNKF